LPNARLKRNFRQYPRPRIEAQLLANAWNPAARRRLFD